MSLRPKLYIIDASAYVFRAYFALAPLSSKGRPSHALAGFASMILKLLKDHGPENCVVVFDSKKPTFRKDIFPEYKANRDAPPPDLSDQIVAVMDLCKAADLAILQGEGFEADDWIASLVKKSEKDFEVVILSSDKDLTQLINPQVSMFDSFRNRWIRKPEVIEKWGVPPEQMLDLLALTGDTSDNIPGIDGVGPKTAARLLTDYQSIDGIYEHLEELSPKMAEKFKQGKEAVTLSKKLIALKDDLPIDARLIHRMPEKFPPKFMEFLIDWDLGRIIKQFHSGIEGKGSDEPSADSRDAKESGVPAKFSSSEISKQLVNTVDDLAQLEKEVVAAGLIAFDTETSSFDRFRARIVGLSISTGKRSVYVPWRHQGGSIPESIVAKFAKNVFENPQVQKIAHNAKYDLQILKKEGVHTVGLIHDTMIAAYLLHADRRSFSLENLARDFLQEEKGDLDSLLEGHDDFSGVPLDKAVEYAAQDASLTYNLYQLFSPALERDERLRWLFQNVELPLIHTLAAMEDAGVLIDRQHLAKLSVDMHRRLGILEKSVYEQAGREFNIGSPKQLQQVLFEDLKLTPTKKTKTGWSTDESVLEELASEHEVPRLIMVQRKLAKLTSTYVDVLPNMVNPEDLRLHTHYHQTGTQTGRLSSSEPNLQNIPIRSEEGMEIRRAFVAQKGFTLMSADYSQVELRLISHFAGDEKMIEAFQNHRDIHAETAKIIFGSSDKEFRSRAKAINFGIIYGISAFGLSQQLGIPRGDAKKFIDSYFEQFPRIRTYMEESQKLARERAFCETLFGRRRPLPDIQSKNPTLRSMAERMAINSPLQGTAADIMKWGMVRLFDRLKNEKLHSRILLQVHDELVLEVAEGEEAKIELLVRDCMSDLKGTPAESLRVPLVVDVSFGKNWAEL